MPPGPSPSVEQIVEAFLLPLMMVEVRAAAPLLGRVLSNPDQFVERVYKKHLLPVVERFSEAIGQALPNLPPEERFWRLQFMAGSMTHVLALSGVLPLMSGQPVDRDCADGAAGYFSGGGLAGSGRRPIHEERGTLMRVPLLVLLTAALGLAQSPLPLSMKRAVEIALAPDGSTRAALAQESIQQAQGSCCRGQVRVSAQPRCLYTRIAARPPI